MYPSPFFLDGSFLPQHVHCGGINSASHSPKNYTKFHFAAKTSMQIVTEVGYKLLFYNEFVEYCLQGTNSVQPTQLPPRPPIATIVD